MKKECGTPNCDFTPFCGVDSEGDFVCAHNGAIHHPVKNCVLPDGCKLPTPCTEGDELCLHIMRNATATNHTGETFTPCSTCTSPVQCLDSFGCNPPAIWGIMSKTGEVFMRSCLVCPSICVSEKECSDTRALKNFAKCTGEIHDKSV